MFCRHGRYFLDKIGKKNKNIDRHLDTGRLTSQRRGGLQYIRPAAMKTGIAGNDGFRPEFPIPFGSPFSHGEPLTTCPLPLSTKST